MPGIQIGLKLPVIMNSEALTALELAGEERTNRIMTLVGELPPYNRMVLDRLIGFLVKVSQYSDVNKMNSYNLATMMGPNLLRNQDLNDMQKILHDIRRT